MIEIRFTQFVGTGNDLLSEPSGIAQLSHPDGRFVIVNDTNAQKALFVAKMGDNGKLHSQKLDFPDSPELDDLEGVALSEIGSTLFHPTARTMMMMTARPNGSRASS